MVVIVRVVCISFISFFCISYFSIFILLKRIQLVGTMRLGVDASDIYYSIFIYFVGVALGLVSSVLVYIGAFVTQNYLFKFAYFMSGSILLIELILLTKIIFFSIHQVLL